MVAMYAPAPSPVERRPYKYSVVKEFLALDRHVAEQKVRNGDGRNAVRTDDNYLRPDLQPLPGQDGFNDALDALINKNGGPECCRLVYITRHAESEHNVKALELGKNESFAAADHFDAERDPSLSARGVAQANMLGNRILGSKAASFGLPSVVHCSPLWRCIQTAAYSAAEYHFSIDIKLNEGWREWKGPGQLHVSDARSTKSALWGRLDSLRGQTGNAELTVQFPDGFTEMDKAFYDPETFVNVDIRLERALDEVFQPGPLCRHIVTHGRTAHSLMRLVGFKGHSVGLEEYRVWDFENAGTVVALVKREPRFDQDAQLERDRRLQLEELRFINVRYALDINSGFEGIQRGVAQNPALRKVWLEKLDALRAEMQKNDCVSWRYELLAKALQGTFRHGEFEVRMDIR